MTGIPFFCGRDGFATGPGPIAGCISSVGRELNNIFHLQMHPPDTPANASMSKVDHVRAEFWPQP